MYVAVASWGEFTPLYLPGFHLEQNLVVDGRDALMRRLVVGELRGRLDQQRVLDLLVVGAAAASRPALGGQCLQPLCNLNRSSSAIDVT